MAYVSQAKKAKIAEALKAFMPKTWKYSLAVRNHSTIVMTIKSAPIDLIGLCKYENKYGRYIRVNEFYLERAFDGEVLELFQKIKTALNIDNFDNSDPQTDYFHCGHYVNLNIGKWNKPFVVSA